MHSPCGMADHQGRNLGAETSGTRARTEWGVGAGPIFSLPALFYVGLLAMLVLLPFGNQAEATSLPVSDQSMLSRESAIASSEREAPPKRPSILETELKLYIVRGNISEIVRSIYRCVGPEFRWAYPNDGIFLGEFVTVDNRENPQTVSSVLDDICEQVGLQWQVHQGVIVFFLPLTEEEVVSQLGIWNDANADIDERIRAARKLAHTGNTDAMVWLFQQFEGKKVLPDDLGSSPLRFVGRRLRFPYAYGGFGRTSSTDGLSSPYLLVGDRPEVVSAIRGMLDGNFGFGLSMAIATRAAVLEDEIITKIIEMGQRPPSGRWMDRRLQNQYIRDLASEPSLERVIASLPTADNEFRLRMLENLGWRGAPVAISALEEAANTVLTKVSTDRQDLSEEDLQELRVTLQGLLRLEVPGWRTAILALFAEDSLPESVQEVLVRAFGSDRGPETATILGRYVETSGDESSSLGKIAIRTLGSRVDENAFRVMKRLLRLNGPAAESVARILALRHDEEAARWIAERVLEGNNSSIRTLFASRLPWVLDVVETALKNGDRKLWINSFKYSFRYHRSSEADALASRFIVGDGPEELRLAAIEGMTGSSGAWRIPANNKSLQALADEPSQKLRQRAMEELGGFGFNSIEENRKFLITKAKEGNLEAAAQMAYILSKLEGAERNEVMTWITSTAATGAPELRAVALAQLGHFASYSEGTQRQKVFDVMMQTATLGTSELKDLAIRQMRSVWGSSRPELLKQLPEDAPYLEQVLGNRGRRQLREARRDDVEDALEVDDTF